MKEIIIRTQADMDALPGHFDEYTVVKITGEASVSQRFDNGHVEALESSHVVARGSSHVEALESSHVVARESSHVVARGSSHVEALGSSHVEAWGSSRVEAWGNATVTANGIGVEVLLWWFAACVCLSGKVVRKSKTATIVKTQQIKAGANWLASSGVKVERGYAVLYKRTSKDFLTQEGTPRQTAWKIGTTVKHPNWNPKLSECDGGKFHACPAPYLCDEFRNGDKSDRYIAIKISVKHLFVWKERPLYPHKVAFKQGAVLYECDRHGKQIEARS